MKKWKRAGWMAAALTVLFSAAYITVSAAGGQEKEIVYTSMRKSIMDTSGDGTKDNPYNRFEDALTNVADGGKIYILASGEAVVNDQGNDMPLIIDKEVVIEPEPGTERAKLYSRAAGIVLGADVTFRNIKFAAAQPYHAQIFANGHRLSLINVSREAGHRLLDVVAGSLYDTRGVRLGPEPGDLGEVIIQGKQSEFGNIYAGSINGRFDSNVSISVQDVSSTKLGEMYGCGAHEAVFDRDNWFDTSEPPAPEADAAAYPVTGNVDFSLERVFVRKVDGSGAEGGARVTFSTEYMEDNLMLLNIVALTVKKGVLKPRTLTAAYAGKINMTIEESGTLDLSAAGNIKAHDFIGGGKLVLDKGGVLKIEGNVTGRTAFETSGGINGCSGIALENHTYIEVPTQVYGTFSYVPYPTQSDFQFLRQEDGSWKMLKDPEAALRLTIVYFSNDERKGDVSRFWDTFNPETEGPAGATALANPGYHFVRWTDIEENEVSTQEHFIPQPVNGVYGEQYYACFENNTYSVGFQANGGSGEPMPDQQFVYGETAELSVNVYTRAGYIFKGWSTNPDGIGRLLSDAQRVQNLTDEQNGRVLLYAQWETKQSSTETDESETDAGGTETEPETKDSEATEPQETETQEPETKVPEPETKDSETQGTETQETETKAPEAQEPETKEPEREEPETKESETNKIEPATKAPGETGSKPVPSEKVSLAKPKIKIQKKRKYVIIKYGKVKGADGYEIYRSVKKKKGYHRIADTKNLTYKNTRLPEKTLYYKVRAYKKVKGKKVRSAYSAVRTVRIK
ncbi:InlB B-repeat-containing protein [Lachnospiraceae bacterium 46-15]